MVPYRTLRRASVVDTSIRASQQLPGSGEEKGRGKPWTGDVAARIFLMFLLSPEPPLKKS